MTDDTLHRVGWGPFAIPGEEKRRQLRMQKYEAAATALEESDLAARYDRYVNSLLDARDELIRQRRHRCIALEVIEQELRQLGVEL